MNAFMNEQIRLKLAEMNAEAPEEPHPTLEAVDTTWHRSVRRSPVRRALVGLALRLRPTPAWTMAPDPAAVRRRLTGRQ
jgi:hypothetical protein